MSVSRTIRIQRSITSTTAEIARLESILVRAQAAEAEAEADLPRLGHDLDRRRGARKGTEAVLRQKRERLAAWQARLEAGDYDEYD